MEKYKRWIDQGTGINPFVPFIKKSNPEESFVAKLFQFLAWITIKPILMLIKFPMLLIMLFTSWIVTWIVSMIPIWFIRRPLQRYTHFFLFRAMLFLFGFFNLRVTHVNKQNKVMDTSSIFFNFNHGDVIFANHISYVEILYLAYRYAPVFTRIVKVPSSDKTSVQRVSAISCLLSTWFASDKIEESSSNESLSNVCKYAKENHMGPVIVFPEAVTSNGRAILKFQNIFDDQFYTVLKQEQLRIHTVCFLFTYRHFSPSYHIQGTLIGHVLQLLGQFYNTLHVRVMETDDVHTHFSPLQIRTNLETLLVALEEEQHGSSLAKKKCVSFGVQDKQEFAAFFKQTQGQYYGDKSE